MVVFSIKSWQHGSMAACIGKANGVTNSVGDEGGYGMVRMS
jgi:hypothetical protein